MSTPRLAILFLGLLSLPVLIAGTCREQREVVGIEHSVTITLENLDTLPTHLFVTQAGENFPCCQVAVGSSRPVELFIDGPGGIGLRAGRNQAILPGGSFNALITQADFDAGEATFVWLGNGWSRG